MPSLYSVSNRLARPLHHMRSGFSDHFRRPGGIYFLLLGLRLEVASSGPPSCVSKPLYDRRCVVTDPYPVFLLDMRTELDLADHSEDYGRGFNSILPSDPHLAFNGRSVCDIESCKCQDMAEEVGI